MFERTTYYWFELRRRPDGGTFVVVGDDVVTWKPNIRDARKWVDGQLAKQRQRKARERKRAAQ